MHGISKFITFLVLIIRTSGESYTPIVLWHGMVDTCCNEISMGMLMNHLKEALPGVHMLSLMIGNNTQEDFLNGFFMHPNEQIEIACSIVNSDPLLANGYNAVGVSQGSQLIRGLLQKCSGPQMKTLITMAGQHQGYYGIPFCDPFTTPRCDSIRKTLSRFAYFSSTQKRSTQATFWHDPLNEETYKHKNTYLADINNEIFINQTYITNLKSLEKFVMIKYERETMVVPKESSWFEFYAPGQSEKILPLRESDLYISDRLGLKQMDKDGKLHFLLAPWLHWQFDWPWFKENIVDIYLK